MSVHRTERWNCSRRCGLAAKALTPTVATTTPFGLRIHALAIYHKSFQALSYERPRGLVRSAFGLAVSEGARHRKPTPLYRPGRCQRRNRRSDPGHERLSFCLPHVG